MNDSVHPDRRVSRADVACWRGAATPARMQSFGTAPAPPSVRAACDLGWRRVVVVGCSGAGKTTFALRLAAALRVPVIHLDAEYWRPGWQHTPTDEWRARVDDLADRQEWVMDGNYGGTLERRLRRAHAAVFLDVSRWTCLRRVVLRSWRYRGRPGPGLPDGCPERLEWQFLLWVWNFERRSRGRVISLLTEWDLPVLHFTNTRDAERWLTT